MTNTTGKAGIEASSPPEEASEMNWDSAIDVLRRMINQLEEL